MQKPFIVSDNPSLRMQFNSSITLCWSSRSWTLTIIALRRPFHETASSWYCLKSFSSGILTAKPFDSWRNCLTVCKTARNIHALNDQISNWGERGMTIKANVTFKLMGAFIISSHLERHSSACLIKSSTVSVSGSWIPSSKIYLTWNQVLW